MNYQHLAKTLNSARIYLLILLGFLAVVGIGNYAEASIGLKIQPVKVSHTIEPGESTAGRINITNVSGNSVKVGVKTEDFIPMAGTYDIQFIGRTEGLTTVMDWITLDAPPSFILQKGETKKVAYTINAPADAEPGGHFGVAFFKATGLSEEGKQLKVGTQVGMLIFVTVPGNQLQKGKILDFLAPRFAQKGPVNFTIRFENTGTVHFEPKGAIKITNIFGKAVGDVPVQGQVVLPTGARDLTAQWNAAGFLLGRYKAELKITDGEGNVLTAESIAFYAFPIWYVLAFLLTIAALFFSLKFVRSRLKFSISLKK